MQIGYYQKVSIHFAISGIWTHKCQSHRLRWCVGVPIIHKHLCVCRCVCVRVCGVCTCVRTHSFFVWASLKDMGRSHIKTLHSRMHILWILIRVEGALLLVISTTQITVTSHNSVANYRQLDCLIKSLFRPKKIKHQSFVLLTLYGALPVTQKCK